MNELSLFTGTGGGSLGTKLLGFNTIGYVERNKYCCRVIEQRIKDGLLDDAPIYCGDIGEFISNGFAENYAGMVDVITAGFPCQPFTTSGQQLGKGDPRNQWPTTRDIIETIKPEYLFLENVPGLATTTYFKEIVQDIANLGYDARWTSLGADDVGAPHKRKRLWIVANAHQSRRKASLSAKARRQAGFTNQLDNTDKKYLWPTNALESDWVGEPTRLLGADTGRCGDCGDHWCIQHQCHLRYCGCPTNEIHCQDCKEWTHSPDTAVCEWCGNSNTHKPGLDGLVNGSASRMDRFEAIGNGQVPAVAALAWEILHMKK